MGLHLTTLYKYAYYNSLTWHREQQVASSGSGSVGEKKERYVLITS